MILAFPRLIITDGSAEALKWCAVLLMTGDHVNKYLLNSALPFLFEMGRLAMPLFVVVLAYNLARENALNQGAYLRVIRRLSLFGLLATPAFIALGGLLAGWWPLNIMFSFLVLTSTLYLVESRTIGGYAAAAMVFLVGGAFVEFWWSALTFGMAVWFYCKRPGWIPCVMAITALGALWFVSGDLWALAAILVVLLASRLDLHVPRLRWFFYFYYPLHLAAIWLIRIPMRKAGYLFF